MEELQTGRADRKVIGLLWGPASQQPHRSRVRTVWVMWRWLKVYGKVCVGCVFLNLFKFLYLMYKGLEYPQSLVTFGFLEPISFRYSGLTVIFKQHFMNPVPRFYYPELLMKIPSFFSSFLFPPSRLLTFFLLLLVPYLSLYATHLDTHSSIHLLICFSPRGKGRG